MRHIQDAMRDVARQPQTQASLEDQLVALIDVATKLGLYDAADFLKDRTGRR
jgi:hypothetical protein